MHKGPNKVFKNLGSLKTGNDLRPQVTFVSTRQTDQKSIGPCAPSVPQTKTLHLLRKDGRKSPQSPKSYMLCQDIKSLSTLFQLQSDLTDLTVPLVDAEVN